MLSCGELNRVRTCGGHAVSGLVALEAMHEADLGSESLATEGRWFSAGPPGARKMIGSVAKRIATLLVVVATPTAFGQDEAQPQPQFVGNRICQPCHPQVWRDFIRNPHFQSIALENEPPERTGCEGCHGPGGLHVVNADKEKIIRFPLLAPSVAQDRCLRCHSDDFGKLHIRRSAHMTAEVGCSSCHSIHGSHPIGPLLSANQREVCYACHQEIRTRFDMPFKHRVNEGAMDCTDCHNPHGAPIATWRAGRAPRMVSQAFGNDLPCTKCHTDKRGPFLHEHPPVRVEGCPSCHAPHGSTNPRLLGRPAVFTLCLECHGDSTEFGLRGEGILGPGRVFHNLADPAFRDCVLCHSRIHGSNADSLFRR